MEILMNLLALNGLWIGIGLMAIGFSLAGHYMPQR
jgi:hypothetical protein